MTPADIAALSLTDATALLEQLHAHVAALLRTMRGGTTSASNILATVATLSDIPVAAILAKNRTVAVARARHLAIWLLHTQAHLTLQEAAYAVHLGHHTTAKYAVARFNGRATLEDAKLRDRALAALGVTP